MKMDEHWEHFLVPRDFDKFCTESIPEIKLKPQVNKEVADSFKIIRHLLEHSFFHFEFYDVAVTKCMFTFEMALKIRYKEVCNSEWNGSLAGLIDWFHKRNYFEVYNDYFLHWYRKFRNSEAHPKGYSIAGSLKRQWITHTIDLINALYENPKLRYKRMSLTTTLNRKLSELSSNGIKVITPQNEFLCSNFSLIFVNNKDKPFKASFYCRPIFRISENYLHEKVIYESSIIYYLSHSFRILRDKLVLQILDGDIEVCTIPKEEYDDYFNWKKLYDGYNNMVMDSTLWNSELSRQFERELREFNML